MFFDKRGFDKHDCCRDPWSPSVWGPEKPPYGRSHYGPRSPYGPGRSPYGPGRPPYGRSPYGRGRSPYGPKPY